MNVSGDVITIRKIAGDSHINSRPAVSTIRKIRTCYVSTSRKYFQRCSDKFGPVVITIRTFPVIWKQFEHFRWYDNDSNLSGGVCTIWTFLVTLRYKSRTWCDYNTNFLVYPRCEHFWRCSNKFQPWCVYESNMSDDVMSIIWTFTVGFRKISDLLWLRIERFW